MVRNGVRVLSTRMARRSRRGGLSGQADPADRAVRGRGRSGRAGASVSKRMAALPDVPTIAETLPGFEALNWFVLAAPAGTPAAVIDRLHAATLEAMKRAALRPMFERDGLDVVGSSRAQARAFIAHEIGKWTQIIEEKGLQIQ
ncbi:hypothetical protein D8B29_04320 [Verminephrobacter eiseniae]|nr:hypothetical protein [Verminephrobacter eiseniae]MCW5301987.1 hypothetical protein [Verminephrobacter eiseniae]MCW8178877.1 hypothetical protein [Verminephrobacter eiseniae]MCW8190106.1 hypothetical protein [Verminephrobacter eiseniae]